MALRPRVTVLFMMCMVSVKVSLADFGDREGAIVQLDDTDEYCQASMWPVAARKCCVMHQAHPTLHIGRTWGTLPSEGQQRWTDLECDAYQAQLESTRQNERAVGDLGAAAEVSTACRDPSNFYTWMCQEIHTGRFPVHYLLGPACMV